MKRMWIKKEDVFKEVMKWNNVGWMNVWSHERESEMMIGGGLMIKIMKIMISGWLMMMMKVKINGG